MRRRLVINLVAVALASAVLLVYAFTQLIAGAIFDDSYPLYVRLPDSGGLIAEQEVAVSGRVVGRVESVDLSDDGVLAALAINAGQQIPRDSKVVVLRRSSVGEQAIDFRPEEGGEPYFEPGETVEAPDAITPVPVQRLLVSANEVLGAVDPESAAATLSEVADAVRGRGDDLREIIRDSARFSEAVAANDADIERFFREGRTVAAALSDSREVLARSIGEMADAAQVLVDMRSEFEGLLVEAPPTLAQLGGLVGRSQPNIACVLSDLGSINDFMARPEMLAEASEALRLNRWFFVGFDVITQPDQDWGNWQRIHFVEEPPFANLYEPRRPIPPTLPGGACSSPFGEGAPAAHQAGYTLVSPESRIIPPPDNRAVPVRSEGQPLRTGAPTAAPPPPSGPLPATGLEVLWLLVTGLALVGLGEALRRRGVRS